MFKSRNTIKALNFFVQPLILIIRSQKECDVEYITISLQESSSDRAVQSVGLRPRAFWKCGFEARAVVWMSVS